MIKFLADENIPPAVARFLRDRGFDVREVSAEEFCGVSDDEIVALAIKEQRALLTFDKHFANILSYPPSGYHGIIRIRIHPPLIDDILLALHQLLTKLEANKIEGSLIVLEREGFRIRRTP